MYKLFSEHPATVGETYFEHLLAAANFGIRMMLAGIACLLHGVFPFLFVKTGSRAVAQLHESMLTKRDRRLLATTDAATATPQPPRSRDTGHRLSVPTQPLSHSAGITSRH
ncbi:DUF6356 family protein [Altererythrobacter arenosus]|uniref:DUF6356 family protein n=1 Tax=Altererythrobacter arenosus TaxID=3032592 RepID=A0ABY8FMA6_9SPHN|nr:DUF6356 family protein [Altererythrobacter sp. CAU 1644]WFL76154.1 DUF6356 family protein [Altererythrobacter sp. CAU 1644]